MVKLDLGGGRFPRYGYLNVDKWERADIVCDLEKGLYRRFLWIFKRRIKSDSVDAIHTSHTLEHIERFIPLMNECWRVLKTGGYIEIFVPRFPHTDSVVDPTHVRFFIADTFKYFSADHPLVYVYGIKPWHLIQLGESENEVYCKMEPNKLF